MLFVAMETPIITRRQLLQTAGLATVGLAAGVSDAYWIEPSRIVLEKIEVPLARLPTQLDGIRIVQLSDFHYVTPHDGEIIRRAVHVANELNPDLIVLTGDYVSAEHRISAAAARNAAPCAEILGDLRAPLGVYAILGNHDQCDPEFITHTLGSRGIAVLRNQAIFVKRGGARLWIAGVDDVLHRRARLEETLRPIPPNESTLLLAHEPDFADTVRRFPVDLQLSGHSHGGQVRFPFIGMPFLPDLAQKYPVGLRQLGSLSLYTNRGLGTTFLPVRFDSPPEVTLMTLHSLEHG